MRRRCASFVVVVGTARLTLAPSLRRTVSSKMSTALSTKRRTRSRSQTWHEHACTSAVSPPVVRPSQFVPARASPLVHALCCLRCYCRCPPRSLSLDTHLYRSPLCNLQIASVSSSHAAGRGGTATKGTQRAADDEVQWAVDSGSPRCADEPRANTRLGLAQPQSGGASGDSLERASVPDDTVRPTGPRFGRSPVSLARCSPSSLFLLHALSRRFFPRQTNSTLPWSR